MNSAAILLTLAAIGVDVGWQEQEDGSIEYIIQIEPELVGTLKEGEDLTSGIRPELRNIRRYRVVVGSKKLPQNPPLAELKRRLAVEKAAAEAKAAPAKRAEQPSKKAEKKSEVPPAFQNPPAPLEFPDVPESPFGDNSQAIDPFDKHDEEPKKLEKGPTPAATEESKASKPKDEPQVSDSASTPPPTFHTDDTEKPLIKHVAAYGDASGVDSQSAADEIANESIVAGDDSPARPWGVMIAVLLALFASLGLNAFLGWITVEQRGRYRSLLTRNSAAQSVAG